MKARLLFGDRDIHWRAVRAAAARRSAPRTRTPEDAGAVRGLAWNAEALQADLGLEAVFAAMAGEDETIREAARRVMLGEMPATTEAVRYRQEVLEDCLRRPALVRALYASAVAATHKPRGHYLGALQRSPGSVLRHAIERMAHLLGFLESLRKFSDRHAAAFRSAGWRRLLSMLQTDLPEEFFGEARAHLRTLRFGEGELISARPGEANRGVDYLLHRPPARTPVLRRLRDALLGRRPARYRFTLAPRDEAGARALGELRSRGIALAAASLGEAADHVHEFFELLRVELAFYVGCLNLHEALGRLGVPVCVPRIEPAEARCLSCRGLRDAALALAGVQPVIGNDLDADARALLVVTGANSGGKSTFLRSLGTAQLMAQSGMFCAAEALRTSLCSGFFSHFKREEDARLEYGKFEEELARMSLIVDHIRPGAMLLLNESFAATNEREGSEIAGQVIEALLEHGVRVCCVTHLHTLARALEERAAGEALFLRAGRQADGTRSFRLEEGTPLPGSYGEDLYARVFGARPEAGSAGAPRAAARGR